jgi:anti-anti-sigma factor
VPESTKSTLPVPHVLALRGDIDLASYHQVSGVLLAQLTRADGPVRVDLSEVTFLAAVGVRVLLVAADTARRHGVPLHFGPLSRAVRMVLDATGTRTELGC